MGVANLMIFAKKYLFQFSELITDVDQLILGQQSLRRIVLALLASHSIDTSIHVMLVHKHLNNLPLIRIPSITICTHLLVLIINLIIFPI